AGTRGGRAGAVGEQWRLEGGGGADGVLAVGTANAQATKLAVDAYGGPEFRLAEQNFAKFAGALTRINQPLVPQFLMSGGQGGESSNAGLIPTAMLSSMFGQMMPAALEKLRNEAPQAARRTNGAGGDATAARLTSLQRETKPASRAARLPVPANLLRLLQRYAVTPVDSCDCPVRTQPCDRLVDRVAQIVVGPDHADSDIPAQVGLALVEIEDSNRLVRMRQVEIAGGCRRDRRGIDLLIGNGLQAVDLESEGRCRHMAQTKGHGRHRADQDADLGALVEALERGEPAALGHGQCHACAIIGL